MLLAFCGFLEKQYRSPSWPSEANKKPQPLSTDLCYQCSVLISNAESGGSFLYLDFHSFSSVKIFDVW
jgi:hypothetical protein